MASWAIIMVGSVAEGRRLEWRSWIFSAAWTGHAQQLLQIGTPVFCLLRVMVRFSNSADGTIVDSAVGSTDGTVDETVDNSVIG